MLEGAPFLLLGAIISGLVDVYLPAGLIKDWLPRSKTQGIFAAMLTGVFFPLCECGTMPVVQRPHPQGRAARRRHRLSSRRAGLNPLAMLSTWVAFRNQEPWLMVALRLGFHRRDPHLPRLLARAPCGRKTCCAGNDHRPRPRAARDDAQPRLELTPRPGNSLGGLQDFTGAVIRDFTGVLLFLIIGAAVAALFSTGFNRNLLAPIGKTSSSARSPASSLAQMLCLCSTTNAFIIAAFAPFSVPRKSPSSSPAAHRPQALLGLPAVAIRRASSHLLWLLATSAVFVLTFLYALMP